MNCYLSGSNSAHKASIHVTPRKRLALVISVGFSIAQDVIQQVLGKELTHKTAAVAQIDCFTR